MTKEFFDCPVCKCHLKRMNWGCDDLTKEPEDRFVCNNCGFEKIIPRKLSDEDIADLLKTKEVI